MCAQYPNPLQNRKYRNELMRHFAQHEIPGCRNNPIFWIKIPKYLFWSDEYRVVRVGNIPHMLNIESGLPNDIFKAIARGFIEIKTSLISLRRNPNESIGSLTNRFRTALYRLLNGQLYIGEIARFLDTDQDIAIECFISASLHYLLSIGSAVSGVIIAGLSFLFGTNPITIPIMVMLTIFCYKETKNALLNEKKMNYALALEQIIRCFYYYPEDILSSNIFVSAIDERSCSPFNFKENYGAWCSFLYIDSLRGAPPANSHDYRRLMNFYITAIRNITVNDQLNDQAIKNYLDNGILNISRNNLVENENDNDEEY